MTDSQKWLSLALVAATSWLIYLLSPILTPFLVSVFFAYLGDPLADRLEAHKVPRTLAVTIVFLAIVILLLLLGAVLVPQLEQQISGLIQRFPGYLKWVKDSVLPWAQTHFGIDGSLRDIALIQKLLAEHWSQAGGIVATMLESVSRSGLALVGWLANLVLIPVLTFYLLRDWDILTAGLRALLPYGVRDMVVGLAAESDRVLGAFLRGQVSVMLALGIIYTTGLWLVGLDFSLLIGVLSGVVSFVPYLGLIVGMLVAGIASVLQFQGPDHLLWVALVFGVGQLLEGSILTPKLVGDRIGLHPVAVIFSVMAGAQLYGFMGILLALPVAAVGMVLVRHAYRRYCESELYAGPRG